MRQRSARGGGALLVALLLWPALAWATRDEDLVARMTDRIKTLTTLMAEKTDPAEKERLAHRRETLEQELAVMKERQAIDAQERALRTMVLAQPREQLRGFLQTVPADSAAVDKHLGDLATRRAEATTELENLRSQLDQLPASADDAVTVKRAELEEGTYVMDEGLRAIALQQEAAEVESDLIAQAQTFRDRLHAADGAAQLSLRGLYEQGSLVQGESASGKQLATRLANVAQNLRNTEAAAGLARQKQEKFDEELKLLENRSGTPQSRPRLERFIAAENAHKQLLGRRLGCLTTQAEALRRTRALLETQEKLNEYGHRFLADQFRNLWLAYLRRLGGPLVVAAALISLYLLISLLVLPRRFQKEELFLARRLGRYATASLVAVIVAMYLIEDIAALATTLGLVSAALVISLQDVCASFFAWFVIMLGHKFTIGDRLEIDGTKGDVIDIQLLRTTLIELNNWLGTDQPTGRIIVIPNNLVFKTKVFNYSHGHPFIWGKIEVTVTYSTPVAAALALFKKVLEEETRQDFAAARQAAATMERRYGVADAEYEPKIHTKLADSGVTLSLFYVSNYRQTSAVRNRLNRRLIAELENHREIQLAYTTMSVLTRQASDGPSAVLGAEAEA
jgi:small-conductance mechanosensitive channel